MTLRYSGPRGKGFSGDKAKAASLQRTADLLVGSVIDRLKAPPFDGKGMLVDRRKLADGSWIHVLVNMIGMRPIVRTWIESPLSEPLLEEYEGIYLPWEHGALYIRPSSLVPFPVFIGNDLRSFYRDVPGFADRIIGGDYYNSENYAAHSPSIPRITKLLNQLEIERYYVLLDVTPPVTLSSMYTGLMRLGVQSWMSVGRSPGAMLYTDGYEPLEAEATDQACPFNSPQPYTDGLIQSPDGMYWWVRIGLSSVTFKNMVPGFADFRKYKLNLDPIKSRVCEIAELVPGSITHSVSVGGLASAIAGKAPLLYGWKFSYDAPWKASVVVHKVGTGSSSGNWYWESTLLTLTFTFDTGEPLVTLDVAELDRKYNFLATQPLWVTNSYAVCALTPPLGATLGPTDDAAPLYCFYGRDNVLQVLRYTKFYENEADDMGSVPWLPCGSGDSGSFSGVSTETSRVKGYSIGPLDLSSVNTSVSRLYRTEDQRQINVSSHTSDELSSALSCSGADFYTQLRAALPEGADYYHPDASITTYMDVYSKDVSQRREYNNSGNQFAIIPGGDAEAVVIGEASESGVVQNYRAVTEAAPENGGDVVEETVHKMMWRVYPGGSSTWQEISVEINLKRSNLAGFGGGYTTETTYIDDVITDTGTVWMVNSRGLAPIAKPSAWGGCQMASILNPCEGCQGANISMAYSNGGYASGGGSDKEIYGGYHFQLAPSPRDIRWIGDA